MIENKFASENIEKLKESGEKITDIFILLGGMNKTVIVSSIQIIEQKLKILGYSKSFISKTKLISIELLDNILKHQSETPEETPYFELSINRNFIKFTTGNCINNETHSELEQKLEKYLSYTQEEIKTEYLNKLKNGSLDNLGNAGLGILTVLKRAKKNYEYNFRKISDAQFYFNNSIIINDLNQISL